MAIDSLLRTTETTRKRVSSAQSTVNDIAQKLVAADQSPIDTRLSQLDNAVTTLAIIINDLNSSLTPVLAHPVISGVSEGVEEMPESFSPLDEKLIKVELGIKHATDELRLILNRVTV